MIDNGDFYISILVNWYFGVFKDNVLYICCYISECLTGLFGQGCLQACTCPLNNQCDHVTGSCDCPAGFGGITCKTPCVAGYFGKGCLQKCECKNENYLCDVINGCVCSNAEYGPECNKGKTNVRSSNRRWEKVWK